MANLFTNDELLLEKVDEELVSLVRSHLGKVNRRQNTESLSNERRKAKYVETITSVYDRIMSTLESASQKTGITQFRVATTGSLRIQSLELSDWILKNGATGDGVLGAAAALQKKGYEVKLTLKPASVVVLYCKFVQ